MTPKPTYPDRRRRDRVGEAPIPVGEAMELTAQKAFVIAAMKKTA
jgi:hypothetical protein